MTYEITCVKGLPADQAALTKAFLTYTASDGGAGQAHRPRLRAAARPRSSTKVQAVVAKIS